MDSPNSDGVHIPCASLEQSNLRLPIRKRPLEPIFNAKNRPLSPICNGIEIHNALNTNHLLRSDPETMSKEFGEQPPPKLVATGNAGLVEIAKL